MKSASFAWQHEPELGAPFELSPVRDANDWPHPTSHEGSQRRPFTADVDGRPGSASWRCVEGERALMRAVLTDAIRCLDGRGREGELLMAEARRWVASRDQRWPFAFESICGVLELDPQTIRRQLGIPARDATEEWPSRVSRASVMLARRDAASGASAAAAGRPGHVTARHRAADDRSPLGLETLTPREREVVHQVVLGLRNAEVATELHITRRTVTTHLANIFRKLGIHERRELLGFALRTAII
jgi:DNA-binding CsgD family transcriptional regulator